MFLSHTLPLTMLTLDATTLFYLNLSLSDKPDGSALIENWKEKIPHRIGRLGSRARSQSRATTPSLTSGSGSSRATHPPSSVRSALSNSNVRIRGEKGTFDRSDSDLDGEGVLSERDETTGAERDAAVNSPHKGKGRATNAASDFILCSSQSNLNCLL